MMNASRFLRLHAAAMFALLVFGLSAASHGQVSRVELAESGIAAYLNLETDRAREYFVAAVNPVIQQPDSIWGVAVQYLTQMHLEAGNNELAEVWMRWAVRHVPEMQIDTLEFLPEVVTLYYTAVADVGGGSSHENVISTSWEWPPLGSRETDGSLRVEPATSPAQISVTVVGLGTVEMGQSLTAPAGSYAMQVAAEGYQEITVTREILPGVISVLDFDLEQAVVVVPPGELPPDVESAVLNNLVRFSAARFRTAPTCGTGYFVGSDGLMLTTYSAIRGAEDLAVELPDGRTVDQDVSVAAWDAERDIAVLRLPIPWQDSIVGTTAVEDGQLMWAFAHPECGVPEVTRLSLAEWGGQPDGLLVLSDTLPQYEQGGPIVNRSGELLGLASGVLSAIPTSRSTAVVNEARRNLSARRVTSLRDVARQENHLYGSIVVQSSLTGAIVQITPLESWHWPGLASEGATPFTFTGPMGKYALQLNDGDQTPYRSELEIDPGLFKEVTEPQLVASSGGGFPVPIAVAGAVGAAAVVGLIVLGGGDDGGQPPTSATQGWIKIPLPTLP